LNFAITTPVVEWLVRVELLSDQAEVISKVSNISMGKLGLVFNLKPDDWRTKLKNNGQEDVLIRHSWWPRPSRPPRNPSASPGLHRQGACSSE